MRQILFLRQNYSDSDFGKTVLFSKFILFIKSLLSFSFDLNLSALSIFGSQVLCLLWNLCLIYSILVCVRVFVPLKQKNSVRVALASLFLAAKQVLTRISAKKKVFPRLFLSIKSLPFLFVWSKVPCFIDFWVATFVFCLKLMFDIFNFSLC